MQAPWRIPFRIKILDDKWDDMPPTPGIYVISSGRSIPGVARADPRGILYVGKSIKLRSRLWQFWYAQHPANGFLWSHPKVASGILATPCQDEKDVEDCLGELSVKAATPVPPADLKPAERAVLYVYLYRFGELPPPNFSLP